MKNSSLFRPNRHHRVPQETSTKWPTPSLAALSPVIVCYVLKDKEVEIVFEFNGLGDWVVYDTGESGFFSEEAMGIAALYSYGTWLVIVTGWSLLIGVVVIIEITRGN